MPSQSHALHAVQQVHGSNCYAYGFVTIMYIAGSNAAAVATHAEWLDAKFG